MSNRPILIVDGLNLFMRHFVVNPAMNESGQHVGGFLGFLKGLQYLCDRIGPSKIVVVWESGGSPRRRAIYKNYKNRRRPQKLNRYYLDDLPDTVDNRDNQVTLIIEALKHTPVTQIYVPDCEADDVIGYVIRNLHEERRIVIVSSDKDYYQLLSKRIIQWSPGQKKYITPKTLVERYGISAINFCTARCFIGDKSDGLPGVGRAGFTSLSKRFSELAKNDFVSVEDLITGAQEKIEEKSLKLYENMIDHAVIAKRNWKLMYLDTHNLSADHIKRIDYALENSVTSGSKISLVKLLLRQGINNFDIDSFYVALTSCTRSVNDD